MLPRFKYFVSIRELLTDLFKLVQSDMSEDKLVGRFEAEMSKIFCRDYVTTVSSYRMGVYYYLKSLNLEKGSEVLLAPITIPDLINVILLLELKPVFVDMDEETHSICINDLIKKYNDKSKVLILTYLSGIVYKSDELISFTQEKDLKVIEDISQAYGSKLGNGDDPYFGDIQVGSLSSGKIISTYTGGVVLSHKEETIQHIISLKENEQLDPPKRRFYFELFSNLKISIATSKLVFPFVYGLFWVMWRIYPEFMQSIAKSKMYTRSEEQDIFFDDYPIRRKSIPEGWRTKLCSWQVFAGIRSIKKMRKGQVERERLGRLLLENLEEAVLRRIPKYAQEENFNFYHLPFKVEQDREVELRELFDLGIDSEGYGLNLCNEEAIFEEFYKELKGATRVKYKSVFIPLHESYSERAILKMAKSLNSLVTRKKVVSC